MSPVRVACAAAAILLATFAMDADTATSREAAPPAGEHLYGPYVRLEREHPAWLVVSDVATRGALVRVQLLDGDGHPVSYGEHPVTISRAVPPGESIEIELGRFFPPPHEGSLVLASSRPVRAVLALDPGPRYPLVPGRSGPVHLTVGGNAGAQLVLAVVAAGEGGADVRVRRARGGDDRSIGDFGLDAHACRSWQVPGRIEPGDVLILDASGSIAAVLFEARAHAGLALIDAGED